MENNCRSSIHRTRYKTIYTGSIYKTLKTILNYFPKKEGLFKISVVYIIYKLLNKFNVVICMKVTGEIFSFHEKRKGAEEVRYQKY